MYEGFLQHDAQEVLQCILGYMQEACDTIRQERRGIQPESSGAASEEENQVSGKRKSDTDVGNAKKKPKCGKSKKTEEPEDEEKSQPLTRSKRRSSSELNKGKEQEEEGEREGVAEGEICGKKASKEAEVKSKKKARLRWLRPSGKQPSIFSKFRSVGKISCTTPKIPNKDEEQQDEEEEEEERASETPAAEEKAAKLQGSLLLLRLSEVITP